MLLLVRGPKAGMITQREVKLYSCSCTICQRSLYLTIDRGSSRRRKLSVVPAPQGAGLICPLCLPSFLYSSERRCSLSYLAYAELRQETSFFILQKGGVPAAPSGTATLLRLSPNHRFRPRPILAVTDFRHPRLSWLDGRCVQGPGTYSPRQG